jgi:hypothetical protein
MYNLLTQFRFPKGQERPDDKRMISIIVYDFM